VTFTADAVTAQVVTFPDGVEQIGDISPSFDLTGSGTDTMTLTFAPGSVVDTWLKVTIDPSKVLDSAGQPLSTGGQGRGEAMSGDTQPQTFGDPPIGGGAVFYFGSLRGDFFADLDPTVPHTITGDDFNAFMAAFEAGDPAADMRGEGFGASAIQPDGLVTAADLDGFISAYNEAVTEGRHLDPLPMRQIGVQSAADPASLPVPMQVTAASSVQEQVAPTPIQAPASAVSAAQSQDDPAPALVQAPVAAPSGEVTALTPVAPAITADVIPPPPDETASAAATTDAAWASPELQASAAVPANSDFEVGAAVQATDTPLDAAAASTPAPAEPPADPALAPDGGLTDASALSPLRNPLEP
jgi:hypothetical protein